jgi:hypothetical protein
MNMIKLLFSRVVLNAENVEDISHIAKLWQESKEWFISLGVVGAVLLAVNIALKLKQALNYKKLGHLLTPLLKEQKETNNSLLELAKGMVLSVQSVKDTAKEMFDNQLVVDERNNQTIKKMLELATITISLSTSPTDIKKSALEIVKEIDSELKTIPLLEKTIELSNIQENGNDTLDDIISSEL